MEIITLASAYPQTSMHALLPALLEHEGHHLEFQREAGGANGIQPTLVLRCLERTCKGNDVILTIDLPRVTRQVTLKVDVRSWFAVDMPPDREVAQAIHDGLSAGFHDPESGEWWLADYIGYDET